jgi:hypothetical protein
MAAATSDLWSVRRLLSSTCAQPRWVSSSTNISHAREKTTGPLLGGDHEDVLVGLRGLLDAGEREVVILGVGGGLDLAALLRPERLELLRVEL